MVVQVKKKKKKQHTHNKPPNNIYTKACHKSFASTVLCYPNTKVTTPDMRKGIGNVWGVVDKTVHNIKSLIKTLVLENLLTNICSTVSDDYFTCVSKAAGETLTRVKID